MPEYMCRRCGYRCSIKTYLKKHYNRKYTCSNLLGGPTTKMCLDELYSNKPTKFPAKPCENPAKPCEDPVKPCENPAKPCEDPAKPCESNFGISDNYFCKFCNIKFTRRDNMITHIKHSCKLAPKTYSEDDISSLLEDKNRQMEDKDRQLRDKDELLAEMRKQIEVLLTKVGNNNNNNINIVLNGFGQEDTSYITGAYIKGLLKYGPYKCIPNLIKNIHFHPEHQENHNIKIPNRNKNIAKIYNGDNKRWELQDKYVALSDMSDKAYNIINEHYDNGTNNSMDKFNDDYDTKNTETTKKLEQDIELTILNNQGFI